MSLITYYSDWRNCEQSAKKYIPLADAEIDAWKKYFYCTRIIFVFAYCMNLLLILTVIYVYRCIRQLSRIIRESCASCALSPKWKVPSHSSPRCNNYFALNYEFKIPIHRLRKFITLLHLFSLHYIDCLLHWILMSSVNKRF